MLLLAISIFCFWDVLWLNFFSDDYHVLHRLTIDKKFWAPGFFRPLSDLTLLFSYYTSGYDAFGFRLFNVIIHGFNAFILFKTLQNVFEFKDQRNTVAAFIASIIFVTYPFHTESIIWIVGRASLVANTFGILSLYFFFSKLNYNLKVFLSCLCYFIGLASYESIFVIPGIIFLALWHRQTIQHAFKWMIPFTATLVLHIIVRLIFAGVLAGNYGKDMFGEEQTNYFSKFIKSFGRLFVPPIHSNTILIIAFCSMLLLIISSFILLVRYRRKYFNFYLLLWLFLLVAHIIPTMFGVDTHTSDGDRLLYFPSYFLSAILAFLIVVSSRSARQWIILSLLLLGVNILLLKKNNNNWIKADAAMTEIFNSIKNNCCKPIYFANMPDAIEGSFVFRNGFYEALQIHNIKGNVQVLNYLKNKEAILQPDTIMAITDSNGYRRIAPAVIVTDKEFLVDSISGGRVFTKAVKRDKDGLFLYWNRNKVVNLLP